MLLNYNLSLTVVGPSTMFTQQFSSTVFGTECPEDEYEQLEAELRKAFNSIKLTSDTTVRKEQRQMENVKMEDAAVCERGMGPLDHVFNRMIGIAEKSITVAGKAEVVVDRIVGVDEDMQKRGLQEVVDEQSLILCMDKLIDNIDLNLNRVGEAFSRL